MYICLTVSLEQCLQFKTGLCRTDLWLPRQRGLGEGWIGSLGLEDAKLLYTEWINNKVPLYSTGNYIQYLVISHSEQEYI